jgi:hypothetical protein
MEVVEHLLHHITDVGLHLAFPSDWGLGTQSALHECMQQAVEQGLFDVGDYLSEWRLASSEALQLSPQCEEYNRILLQVTAAERAVGYGASCCRRCTASCCGRG